MSHQVTIGGERLNSGKKMKATLKSYERSTHDLSYVWRSTMAAGTLVPFMTEVALPGDTFDIHLNADVLTHPTIGPLFGSYKLQLDVFQIPIRLYQGKLHMNMLGIGLDMSKVKLPIIEVRGKKYDISQPLDNQQINPSSILSYLGIRGLGQNASDVVTEEVMRTFNAIPYLGYWDIYKNYYANKQEEIGYVIHRAAAANVLEITDAWYQTEIGAIEQNLTPDPTEPYSWENFTASSQSFITILATGITNQTDPSTIFLVTRANETAETFNISLDQLYRDFNINPDTGIIIATNPISSEWEFGFTIQMAGIYQSPDAVSQDDTEPILTEFDLSAIDDMRMSILQEVASETPFTISTGANLPYGAVLDQTNEVEESERRYSATYNQEGLGIKTYQSDLLNNWISTEWIDGTDGISAITAVDTSGGSFTIDELNLSKKVYDMLNRIAISGGSYDDWLDAVYDHDRTKSAENPMYMGGLIKNVVFQEVISNALSADQPLGTLAGRGKIGQTHKGGKVIVKVSEPSYIMGIVSLTPNIDYSQGNKWDVNLRTMNDFHKPALDEIGFQDLITDQMAHWDTTVDDSGIPTFKSAGKQPAWVNYMTNIDVVKGNFADIDQQMFMVLNRRYNATVNGGGVFSIKDLTTYIDPVKCNYIFADTRRDAQNFWTQIGVNMEARRKMSAKIMPNL